MHTRLALFTTLFAAASLHAAPPEPKFRAVTIDDKIQIGYGVAVADVDGDKAPDVLLADKRQIVWYRNPGAEKSGDPAAWQKHVIAENLTPKDNVCLAAQDIDGDGKCEVAVGAEWNPGDTVNSGAVFYLIAPADRTQPWTPVKLHAEPTTHRMRWIKLTEETSKPAADPAAPSAEFSTARIPWGLVVVPLHGRGNKNGEGAGVRVLLYHPPTPLNDPKGEWKTELIDDSMHSAHNFDRVRSSTEAILLGGKEGITELQRLATGKWQQEAMVRNNASVGVGEVRSGLLPLTGGSDVSVAGEGGNNFVAAVEPMHGQNLVVYSWSLPQTFRALLTDKLTEGHALGCGDLLGVKSDQIVVGWRGGSAERKPGVALWAPLDPEGKEWRETLIDDGGMACEDLQLADLNADGRLDIVASGRATKNVKVYFNETGR